MTMARSTASPRAARRRAHPTESTCGPFWPETPDTPEVPNDVDNGHLPRPPLRIERANTTPRRCAYWRDDLGGVKVNVANSELRRASRDVMWRGCDRATRRRRSQDLR